MKAGMVGGGRGGHFENHKGGCSIWLGRDLMDRTSQSGGAVGCLRRAEIGKVRVL